MGRVHAKGESRVFLNIHHRYIICRTKGVEVCNLVDLYEHSVQSATRAFRSSSSHEVTIIQNRDDVDPETVG